MLGITEREEKGGCTPSPPMETTSKCMFPNQLILNIVSFIFLHSWNKNKHVIPFNWSHAIKIFEPLFVFFQAAINKIILQEMSVSRPIPNQNRTMFSPSYIVQSWHLNLACERKLASKIAERGYLKPFQKTFWGWSNSVETEQFIPDASVNPQNSTLSHPSPGLAASFICFFYAYTLVMQRVQLSQWSHYHLSNKSSASIFFLLL